MLIILFAGVLAGVVVTLMDQRIARICSILVGLGAFYCTLAVASKRWHDRDKSGWWSLIGLVPVVGALWLIVENGFLPGTAGRNRFGPDPLRANGSGRPRR